MADRIINFLGPYSAFCLYVLKIIWAVLLVTFSFTSYIVLLFTPAFREFAEWSQLDNITAGFLILLVYGGLFLSLLAATRYGACKLILTHVGCIFLPIGVMRFTKFCEENRELYPVMMFTMWGLVMFLSYFVITEDFGYIDNLAALTLAICYKYHHEFSMYGWTASPAIARRLFPFIMKLFMRADEGFRLQVTLREIVVSEGTSDDEEPVGLTSLEH